MTDLFANIAEAKDERQAIQMADGITTSVEELHRCEVISILNRHFPVEYNEHSVKEAGRNIEQFCDMVAKARGRAAADQLLADCRKEWMKRKEAA